LPKPPVKIDPNQKKKNMNLNANQKKKKKDDEEKISRETPYYPSFFCKTERIKLKRKASYTI
jgi:hypothetical protein